ncbi:hypothetical protein OIU79_013120 [Salix purpurea]|uniref:Protein kinase domain-containing protein n=1 Tax=Salix purpurea TaxID=77065 RepID=A0A9Q0Q566_SALPP|nr:hypothetical protein OIU79_013120 [Salix purpurea]
MLDSKCKTLLGDLGAALFLDQPDLALQTRKMVGKFGYVAPGFSYQGSKHEMDFNKQEHPIAKQRPKISQAIEVLKLEVPMTNLPFEMPPFISGISST